MSRAIKWWVRVVVIVGVAAFWAGSEAQAQSTSTIQGTVTDTQGAVVPGVTVVVRNQATGLERTLQTDGAGQYQAAALPPGTYRIETHLQGFLDTAQEVEPKWREPLSRIFASPSAPSRSKSPFQQVLP